MTTRIIISENFAIMDYLCLFVYVNNNSKRSGWISMTLDSSSVAPTANRFNEKALNHK